MLVGSLGDNTWRKQGGTPSGRPSWHWPPPRSSRCGLQSGQRKNFAIDGFKILGLCCQQRWRISRTGCKGERWLKCSLFSQAGISPEEKTCSLMCRHQWRRPGPQDKAHLDPLFGYKCWLSPRASREEGQLGSSQLHKRGSHLLDISVQSQNFPDSLGMSDNYKEMNQRIVCDVQGSLRGWSKGTYF